MSETETTPPESPPPPAEEPKRPRWWSELQELRWDQVKTAILAGIGEIGQGLGKLDKTVTEQAVKFGHGAGEAFDKLSAWSGDVEKKLRVEWEATGAKEAWEKVREAVQHGWERAHAAATSAASKKAEVQAEGPAAPAEASATPPAAADTPAAPVTGSDKPEAEK